MRPIAVLAAIAAFTTLGIAAATPKGSVGGSMTLALFLLLAVLAVGLYDAWLKGRGMLGWILSVVVSLVGGIIGSMIAGIVMVGAHMILKLDGSLMAQPPPFRHVVLAIWMFGVLLGSWSALQAMSRSG